MGFRVLHMYQYRQIIHQIRQGLSDREIAKQKLVGRTKCATIRAIAKAQGWLNSSQELPSDEILSQTFLPPKRVHQTCSSAEPYRDFILQCHEQNLPTTAIYQVLIHRFGYTGSYDSVRRFLKRYKPNTIKATVPLNFEPGEAAQIDFGKGPKITDIHTGEIIDSWFFIMTLCFSRHMYVEFIGDQRVETWLGCHRRSFEFFGGVPSKLIIDNPKCAITKACFRDPVVQRAYGDYAQGYGFIISPCPPREPQMKGRVESNVKYCKQNFLPLRDLKSLSDANAQVKQWVLSHAGNRTHGSTHQKPLTMFAEVEKHLLKPLPSVMPEIATWAKAKVHGDCHVQYLKCRYSVPYQYVHQSVWLRASETTIKIYIEHEMISMHSRLFKPGKRATIDEHLPPNASAYLMRDPTWCRKRSIEIGQHCEKVISHLFNDKVLDHLRAAQGILGLAKSYGDVRLNAACRRAIAFNVYNYKSIKAILKQGLEYDALPEEICFDLTGEAYNEGRFIRQPSSKSNKH